ncbi:MAG: hypothetical protein M3550_00565 [Actinomycetota bacterium]|nr:hypothetical protein [Actinomycetota bacterium]
MREITSTVPPCLGQHAPQVDDHLRIDVLAARRVEDFGLRAERHLDLAVVLLGGGPDVVQQRQNFTPFDVAARRMAEDLLDGVAMVVVELRFQRGSPF